jgi:serine/threonine protein kinase
LTDFGLTSGGTSRQAQTTRYSRGTDCYRAPELMCGTVPKYSNKVDMWAIGCILYELVHKQKRFNSDWEMAKHVMAVESGQNPDIDVKAEMVPDERKRSFIVQKLKDLLSIDPNKRPGAKILYEKFTTWGDDVEGKELESNQNTSRARFESQTSDNQIQQIPLVPESPTSNVEEYVPDQEPEILSSTIQSQGLAIDQQLSSLHFETDISRGRNSDDTASSTGETASHTSIPRDPEPSLNEYGPIERRLPYTLAKDGIEFTPIMASNTPTLVERSISHPFIYFEVIDISTFRHHRGADLASFHREDQNAASRIQGFTVREDMTLASFYLEVAGRYGVAPGSDNTRLWRMVRRQNGTMRPNVQITPRDLCLSSHPFYSAD